MEIEKKTGIFDKLYFCFFLLLPFVYFDKLVDPVLIPRQGFLTVFLFILSSLITYKVYEKKLIADFSFLKLPLFISFILFLILVLLSFAQSLALSESIYVFSKLLVEALFLIITTYLLVQNQLSISALIKSVTVFGCIALIQSVFQAARLSMNSSDFFDNMLQVSAAFGHKNLLASILFLTIPFMLASTELSKMWKIAGYLCLLLIPVMAWLLQSKAIIAATVIFIIIRLCLWSTDKNRVEKRFTKMTITVITLLLVLIGLFTVMNREKFPRIFDKKSGWERLGLWENSKHMIQENPLLGVGAGNWQVHFPKYGMDKFLIPEVKNGITTFQRPHNDFLWVFCEMGIAGLLLYVSIFLFIFYYSLQLLRKTKGQKSHFLYSSLFATLACYMLIAFIDFPLERIEHQLIILLLFSIVTSRYYTLLKKNENSKNSQKPLFLLIFLVTPVLFSFLVSSKRWKGELHTQRLYFFERTANWEQMLKEGKKALSVYYTMDPMSAPIEWYNGVALFSLGDKIGAKQCFEKAYAIHPYNMHVINNLASCYESEGNHEKAEEFYLRALTISSEFEEARLNLSAVYFNTKEYEKAFETIDKCDVNSRDPKYGSFLPVILSGWIENLSADQKDSILIQHLKGINGNSKNLLSVYKASKEKGINFKTYILTNKY